MKRPLAISLVLLIMLLLPSSHCVVRAEGETEDRYYFIKSRVTYLNPATESRMWNLTEDDRMISLFMNNSWQNVELTSVNYTLESIQTDEDGNKIGVLKLPRPQLLRGENLSITAEYQVIAKPRLIADISESESEALGAIPQHLVQLYTSAEGPWLTHDPALVELAHEIAGNEIKVLKIVEEAVRWIKDNIEYGTHEYPLYANQTLSAAVGDCDDQAILLITLLRILKVPSYLQIGAIYMPQNAELSFPYWSNHVRIVQRKIGWHGWAMVYVPPWGWLPVDLTYVYQDAEEPLNAIRYSAVAQQNTIQYMNISKVDHVADSLGFRKFILENGFQLHIEDEMIEASSGGARGYNPAVTVIFIVAIVVVVSLIVVLFIRRRKRLEQQKPL